MDIVDVTFNFELFEDNALDSHKKFNESVDALSEMKELWRITIDPDSFDKTAPFFKEYYKSGYVDAGKSYPVRDCDLFKLCNGRCAVHGIV